MSEQIEFIKYGKCPSCKKETCFIYVGKQEFGRLHTHIHIYSCYSCETTISDRVIKNIEQKLE